MLTLDARKQLRQEKALDALSHAEERLSAVATRLDGRYLLYGSAARGSFGPGSDVDLILDFPPHAIQEAWSAAEDILAAVGLPADIRPLAWCRPAFLAHIEADLRPLPAREVELGRRPLD